MSNISIAEILKIHDKWIQASEFEKFVSEKLKIGERHAHNLVKKATNKKEILRVELPNRTVLYGLAEFGPIRKAVVEGHSRQLIPALRKIAGIVESKYSVSGAEEYTSPEDMKILVEMAERYLREDSELGELFESYEQKNEEAGQKKIVFTDGLMKKLTKELGETVNTKKAMRLQSFVGDNLPSLICNHMLYGSPTDLKREGEGIWFGDNLVAKGDEVFGKIDEFVKRETADESNITAIKQIEKIELDAFEAQRKLQPEIRNLIMRIKSENQ